MTALEYLASVREAYVERYRSVLRSKRAEGVNCAPEIWVKPNVPPGEPVPRDPLCIDIIATENDGASMVMIKDVPIEGGLVGTIPVGEVSVRVYSVLWEALHLWIRHTDPDWTALDGWRQKWMDPNRSGEEDPDGLSGVVHFFGAPTAEGGGFLFELDLGSAPIAALSELLEAVVDMGTTEIEIGRSDGSDLPADIQAQLGQPELSMELLAAVVTQLLAQLDEVEKITRISPEEIDYLEKGKSSAHHLNLNNLHRMIQRVGIEARAKEIYRFMRGQREFMAPMDAPELSQLRAVIKDDRFVDNVRRLGPKMKPLVLKNLTADLWIVCVWDSPNGMRFATAEEPDTYGLSADEMLRRAIDNLLKERPTVELSEHGALRIARTGDSYDASLLLDDRWIEEMAATAKGDLLVCVPARHVVLVGSTDQRETVREMQRASARIEAGGDHLVSKTILCRRDGKWERYQPPVTPTAEPPVLKKPWWKVWGT